MIVLSAKNENQLKDVAKNLYSYLTVNRESRSAGLPSLALREPETVNLRDLAYTLQVGREAMEERLAVVVRSPQELEEKIAGFVNGQDDIENLYRGEIKHNKAIVAVLTADGEFEKTIDSCIERSSYSKLLDLWVKGLVIDWNKLYGDSKPRRIVLPTYPFSKERYWIPDSTGTQHPASSIQHLASKLHPLVHENASNFEEQRFSSTFTGEGVFLADHVVQGQKVLPGVAYLEMARAAAEQTGLEQVHTIQDVIWANPIRVTDKAETVTIALYPEHNGASYEVTSGEDTAHSQGKIINKALVEIPQAQDIVAIQRRCKRTIGAGQLYPTFHQLGLHYGPSFQGINTLHYNDQEVLAMIELPVQADFTLNPALLDSALQASIGLGIDTLDSKGNNLYVPFALKEVTWFGSLSGTIYSHVTHSPAGIAKYDVTVLDKTGNVLLQLKRFTARQMALTPITVSSQKETPTDVLYATTEWQDKPLVVAGGQTPFELFELSVAATSTPEEIISTFKEAFNQIKAMLASKPQEAQRLIWTVSDTVLEYSYASIVGLVKTARLENPNLLGKVIVLPKLNSARNKTMIDREAQDMTDVEVRYLSDEQRQVKQLIEVNPQPSELTDSIKTGGVYLITGGAGGLGLIFARYLSQIDDVKIILTGRSKKAKTKVEFDYLPCDVSKLAEVKQTLKTIEAQYGKLNGIIHSAGLIQDNFILKKTEDEIDTVMRPKIQGAWNLHQALKANKMTPDFVVLFSSIAGVLGNLGQADYSGANAFLDAFASEHNYKSINWPLWAEGGMQIDKAAEEWVMNQTGLQPLTTSVGQQALNQALSHPQDQLLVCQGKLDKFRQTLGWQSSSGEHISEQDRAPSTSSQSQVEVEQQLIDLCVGLIKVKREDLEVDVDFNEYGVDSILMMTMLNTLEATYDQSIPPNTIAEYTTIKALAAYLIEQGIAKTQEPPEELTEPKSQNNPLTVQHASDIVIKSKRRQRFSSQTGQRKIAIIGAVCRLPKSPDLESFWQNLAEGKDLISGDTNRWDMQAFYSEDKDAPNKTYTHHGGYLEDIAGFDAGYFNLSDEEAITLDPQHRIVLELAQELFDRAGYTKEKLSNSRASVFMGAKDNGYIRNGYHLVPKNALQHTIVNNISNMISARVSDFYNLKGTSKTIDTACSSSLVAVHDACESIIHGESDMAVAGGVSLIVDPFAHIGFSKAKVLSADGKSYVFDERAQGFVLGEGAGLVLLKDYDKAFRDGDPILGTILGSAVNNDGKTIGLTVPNQHAQKEVIEQALSKAQVNPESITYLEAHGTGTLLGDPIEIKAATEIYRQHTQKVGYCAVGSVKSNVGHTMTAAGMVGLIKILLSMQHQQIPATLHCERPHPRFEFNQSPFYPNATLKPWHPKEGVLRAALSSFGFGGTNCHMIIEEGPPDYRAQRQALPITQFKRKHYWLGHPIEAVSPTTMNRTAIGGISSVKDIATEPRSKALLTLSYNADDPYVADHFVQGKRVLLGVTYCSFALEAATAIEKPEGKAITGLKKLLFVEPMQLDDSDVATINLHYNSSNQFHILAGNNGNLTSRLVAQGIYTTGNVVHPHPIDLDKLKKQATKITTGKVLYSQETAVIHGESLHTVQTIYSHSEYTLVRLKLTAKMLEGFHQYHHVHPALLDGALLGGIALELKDVKTPYIPFMIKTVRYYAKVSSPCYSLTKRVEKNGEIIDCDLSLVDESGRICLELFGFICKRIRNEEEGEVQASVQLIASPRKAPIQSRSDSSELTIRIEGFLVKHLKTLLATDTANVPLDKNFMDLGVDSNQLIGLVNKFEKDLGIELYPTLFFEHQTIKALAEYFATEHQEAWQRYLGYNKQVNVPEPSSLQSVPDQPRESKYPSPTFNFEFKNSKTNPSSTETLEEPIAIVGMAGVFAKSPDLEQFWHHLYQQTDLIQEIPGDHFDYKPWFDVEPKADKMYCKWGAFIDHVDKFDAGFFGISPKEAELMDPQLRYLMQVFYHTAEDAGTINTIRGSHTGVYVGVCFHDYAGEMGRLGKEVEAHDGSGNAATMLANRPSFYFNLTGPSLSVDTACSSSLFSVHLACKALQRGECDMAFAAGVNLLLTSSHYRYFCSIGALSPSGRCHTFDHLADGYVPGEGVGSVLLKPLNKALSERDHIYGIVKGSAISHGGYTPSITAPSVDGEGKVLLEAWKDARINPETLSYIEAHGTGTKLGDPVEVSALRKAFGQLTDKQGFCALGSAKAHIGHAEGAAGIVGLIKVLLSMEHQTLPAMPKFEKINPYIQLNNSPFYINQKPREWKPTSDGQGNLLPRRAGVSSFGFGGAYAHVVIEEFNQEGPRNNVGADVLVGDRMAQIGDQSSGLKNKGPYLIVLSAKNEKRLMEMAENLRDYLTLNRKPGTLNLHEVAYTLQVGREPMEERLGLIVGSIEELAEKLQGFSAGKDDLEDLYRGQIKRNKEFLTALTIDEEFQETINKWVQRGKYGKLLDLWAKGLSFDWNLLYQNHKPLRISLPTYPFAKERHWIPESSIQNPASSNRHQASWLHPLVHKNTSDLSEQRFSSTFRGEEFFLADHIVKGKKILPGVAYLEMAHEAVRQASRGFSENNQGILLKNVVWTRPIVVNEPKEVHIGLFSEKNGGIAYEIYTQAQNMDEEPQIHSQGVAALIPLGSLPSLDLTDLREKLKGNSLNPKDCYDVFKHIGIEYGPAHQGLEKIHVGVDEVLAKLAVPISVSDTKDHFTLHPSLLDSALQASIGIGIGEETVNGSLRPSLPFALEHIKIMARCPKSMWAWVRVARNFGSDGSMTGNVRKLDIDLYDEDGKVCVEMQGFSSRILEGEISEAPEAMGTLMYTPAWKEKFVDPDQQFGEYTKHRVFLCGLTQISQQLQDKVSHIFFTDLESDQNLLEDCFKAYSLQLFEAIQKVLQENPTGDVFIQVLVPNQGPKQVFSGLSGLLKSARLENPKILCQMIAVGEEEREEDLIAKVYANVQFPEDQEIRYEGEKRFVRAFEEMAPSAMGQDVPWKHSGVYLITGGAGGLGLIFAQEIAEKVQGATLILTGRSKLSELKKGNLEKLQSLGATIIYRSVDVCDKEALEVLVQEIQAKFGSLNGIIHGAGVIRDSSILKKSKAEFGKVLAPKVFGVMNLDQASKTLDLDIFVLFSSGAGATGNMGQADYSTANAFMDTFARYRSSLQERNERGGQTLSINWPLWREGGMRVDEATETMMKASTGMVPMETSSGIEAFYQALASDAPQVMVMAGLVKRMKQKLLSSARKISKVKVVTSLQETTSKIDTNHLFAKIQETLTQMVSELLKVKTEDLDVDAELSEYGVDSIMLTDFANRLNQTYQLELTPTILFETTTIGSFAKYLAEEHPQVFLEQFKFPTQEQNVVVTKKVELEKKFEKPRNRSRFVETISSPPPSSKRSDPIAVVGMSGCFPMARDINQFWQNLIEGKNCITEIPKTRWDWRKYFGDPVREYNKTKIKWGGFIPDVDKFDAPFFNISPREAELMDPQQRLFLESVWNAIEDAGYAPSALSGSQTGVFVGVATNDYSELVKETDIQIEAFSSTGIAHSMLANRISYLLNIHGPSEPIDTACSSSLVALHRAAQAIYSGNCEMAIVGGVNVLLTPSGYISFGKAGMLSEDGRCKTFDKRANGYVRGEGVGAMLLKPLVQAEDDGDLIYGLIKGSAENHGGRATSLTAPNPNAQTELLCNAYEQAQMDPSTVTYIETHGTGTELGDPIEINGLKKAFDNLYNKWGNLEVKNSRCGLGSVKSNIGHLESAAGIAGVMKVLLSLKHKKLPATLHINEVNPYIDLKGSPFYIVRETKEWNVLKDEYGAPIPRRAGVSSFGFGGANAHVIIEEYLNELRSGKPEKKNVKRNEKFISATDCLIVLSAKSKNQLEEVAKNLYEFISKQSLNFNSESLNLTNIAFTLQVGREAMEERLALVVRDPHELTEMLRRWIDGTSETNAIFSGNIKANKGRWELLIDGREGEEYLRVIINEKKFRKLAHLWVSGVKIDWNGLYGEELPRRVSLPTYPFSRERYWVPQGHLTNGNQPIGSWLHPLVHINESTLDRQSFKTTFDESAIYAINPWTKRQKFLSPMMYLEMARAAGELSKEEFVGRRIKDVVWDGPIYFCDKSVQLNTELHSDKNSLRYAISTRKQDRAYCQGQLIGEKETREAFLQNDTRLMEERGFHQKYPRDSATIVQSDPEQKFSVLQAALKRVQRSSIDRSKMHEFKEGFEALQRFGRYLLLDAFQRMKIFKKSGEHYDKGKLKKQIELLPQYTHLYEEILSILTRAGFIIQKDGNSIIGDSSLDDKEVKEELKRLEQKKNELALHFPALKTHLDVLWVCLYAYPEILRGKKDHMEVLFPGGNISVIEGLYKGNEFMDYYHEITGEVVRSYIEQRLIQDPDSYIQILEIGAGTGGTTAFVLEAIKEYQQNICYFYTDLSIGFTQQRLQDLWG